MKHGCWPGTVVVWLLLLVGGGGREASAKPDAHLPELMHDEHPLVPVLATAQAAYRRIRSTVRDYSCVLVKRERIGRSLRSYEYLFVKVRARQVRDGRVVTPWSVYLRYLSPVHLRGREVIYVEGRNDNKLIARRGGDRFGYVTVSLDPHEELAMRGNRYPITEMGIENLLKRLIEDAKLVIDADRKQRECRVEYFKDAKVSGRVATCIQVTQLVSRENIDFHLARVYVDEQLQIPIRYETYDWPEIAGQDPRLVQEYTFLQVRLNQGFSDADFDRSVFAKSAP